MFNDLRRLLFTDCNREEVVDWLLTHLLQCLCFGLPLTLFVVFVTIRYRVTHSVTCF